MPRRLPFFLIHTTDPSSADIVREDGLVQDETNAVVKKGSKVKFRWSPGKDKWETLEGTVVEIGLRKDVSALHVDENGNISQVKGVGTRKQELEKRRLMLNNAKERQLQERAERLLDEGAEALCEDLHPVVRVKRPSLPKKRSPALLQLLKEKAENLPCFSSSNGEPFFGEENGIFCDVGALGILRLRYRRQPKVLHLECYKLLIPDELLRTDGISATGKRGCVTFPARLNETITNYVSKVFVQGKVGNLLDIDYDPIEILQNLMDNQRRLHGTIHLEDPAGPAVDPTINNAEDAEGAGVSSDVNGSGEGHQQLPDHSYVEVAAAPVPAPSCTVTIPFHKF